MSKQSLNSLNRKFSLSLLKANQISQNQNQRDELYEFDAPKYFDLSTLPESPVGNDLKIDPWFLVQHSNQANLHKKHPNKKKHYQYQQEHSEESSRKSDIKVEKRNKPPTQDNKTKALKRESKMSIIKTLDSLNLAKERGNNFKSSQSVTKSFNNIKKLKRGVSTDTYTYYNMKLNKEEKENVELNKRGLSKIKITYCPRIHDAKVTKKWEDMKGVKWYNLSPQSRAKANDEISMMIKTNAFEKE